MKTVNRFYASNGAKGLSVFESGCGIDSRCSYLNFLTLRQLDIQAECRFTLKRGYDMIRTHSQKISCGSALLY